MSKATATNVKILDKQPTSNTVKSGGSVKAISTKSGSGSGKVTNK